MNAQQINIQAHVQPKSAGRPIAFDSLGLSSGVAPLAGAMMSYVLAVITMRKFVSGLVIQSCADAKHVAVGMT